MRIFLAPMEGVIDAVMRDTLTAFGGITHCATEFVRVTDRMVPAHVFRRYCPELATGGRTRSGVPVFVQLLGSDAGMLAKNAARAVALGAPGIDLNFGCPAPRVNQHEGGAVLLRCPARVGNIVAAVRASVPAHVPVTAKIRLGYDRPDGAVTIAREVASAGATWLAVHARTRMDGYRPPAHWEWIAKIREAVDLPVIANGEIWTVEDYRRCRQVTGAEDVMLGRGQIASPDLAAQIRFGAERIPWEDLRRVLLRFVLRSRRARGDHFALCRAKQWLRLLGRAYPEGMLLFDEIKRTEDVAELCRAIYNRGAMRYSRLFRERTYVDYSSQAHPR